MLCAPRVSVGLQHEFNRPKGVLFERDTKWHYGTIMHFDSNKTKLNNPKRKDEWPRRPAHNWRVWGWSKRIDPSLGTASAGPGSNWLPNKPCRGEPSFTVLLAAAARSFLPLKKAVAGRGLRMCQLWAVSVSVLSDSATLSNLNAFTFLTVKVMLNPMFGMLTSRAIQNIPDMQGFL